MNISAIGKEVINTKPKARIGLKRFSSIVLGTFLLASSCAVNRTNKTTKDTFNKETTEIIQSNETTENSNRRHLIGEAIFCAGLLAALGYALHDAKKEESNKKQ